MSGVKQLRGVPRVVRVDDPHGGDEIAKRFGFAIPDAQRAEFNAAIQEAGKHYIKCTRPVRRSRRRLWTRWVVAARRILGLKAARAVLRGVKAEAAK